MQNNSTVILSDNTDKSIRIFENSNFGKVRMVLINDIPYFVGKDVAQVLGYIDLTHSVLDHVNENDRVNSKTQGQNSPEFGQRGTWLINESGVYSLVLGSTLPTAKKFKHWVTSEVLPSIAHTGSYDLSKQKKEGFERKSKDTRNAFTDTLKTHGYTKQHEYIQTTVQMKKELGISKPKKEMDMKEKAMILAAEALSMACITDEFGYQEVNPICLDAADNIAGYVEEKTNKKIGV